jgi:hypothetical protein
MRTLPLAVATTGALLASTLAAQATPPKPGPSVQGCGMLVTADPTADGNLGGPTVYNGVVYGGPIVIADTEDLFANAVDGTLRCTVSIAGGTAAEAANSGTQSYVVAVAQQARYDTYFPGNSVSVCGTLDLTNAYGEHATYDLGCRAPDVAPTPQALCVATQFLPQPVRPIVDDALGC